MSEHLPLEGAVIVTGASRGIGAVICRELATRGASVIGVARDSNRLTEVVEGLPGPNHRAVAIDVSDATVWPKVIEASSEAGVLAGVVAAAAILEPIGTLDQIEPDELSRTFEVNVLGTALAIRATLPALRQSRGTIVTFSGGGATKPLPRYDAYAASKAAIVRLTENVAAAEPRVRANSVAPGFVATEMHEVTLAAGAERAGEEYLDETRRQLEQGGVPPELAADLVAVLIGPEGEGITGKLISAQWDPYDEESFRERLRSEPDLCTLRRIDDVFFTVRGENC